MHYKPEQIRTNAHPSDRSADLQFDLKSEPSLTQQQFVRECDINYIVAQNQKTGLLTHPAQGQPIFGDFTEFGPSTDFHAAKTYLAEAQQAFDMLPAEVRARFQNNPGKLLDFVADSKNELEARALGLLKPLPENLPKAAPAPSKGKKTKTIEVPEDFELPTPSEASE